MPRKTKQTKSQARNEKIDQSVMIVQKNEKSATRPVRQSTVQHGNMLDQFFAKPKTKRQGQSKSPPATRKPRATATKQKKVTPSNSVSKLKNQKSVVDAKQLDRSIDGISSITPPTTKAKRQYKKQTEEAKVEIPKTLASKVKNVSSMRQRTKSKASVQSINSLDESRVTNGRIASKADSKESLGAASGVTHYANQDHLESDSEEKPTIRKSSTVMMTAMQRRESFTNQLIEQRKSKAKLAPSSFAQKITIPRLPKQSGQQSGIHSKMAALKSKSKKLDLECS